MRIENLLAILSLRHKEITGTHPNKTKLIKLAYLAEIYFKRNTSNRLTDQKWIYWKYGPYFHEYDSLISDNSIFITPDIYGDYFPIDVRGDFEIPDTNLDENTAIFSALEHASESLDQLLDFVYFDTEPMMGVKRRGDTLDFDIVLPHSFYAVKRLKLSKARGEKICKKIREWEAQNSHAS